MSALPMNKGGTELNPTDAGGLLCDPRSSAGSVTYTIDLDKDYILFFCMKYDGSANLRSGVYKIMHGEISLIVDYYNYPSNSYIKLSLSGTTLTASYTKQNYRIDVSLIQLD